MASDWGLIELKAKVILGIWALVFIAIVFDFISGIRKAKQRGELRTSQGFQRTVKKLILYYGAMTFALMFDIVASFYIDIPVMTTIAAVFLIFIEGKSIYEKAEDKHRRKIQREAAALITLIENKEDIVRGVCEIVKKELKEENDENK